MKITIDCGDHEISYTTHAYGKPLVVGTTTKYGMRVKPLDRPRLGWLMTNSVTLMPDDTDTVHGHPSLYDLVRISRGARGKCPKAVPTFDTAGLALKVSVTRQECSRIYALEREIDRFSTLMGKGRGLRTVAVATLRRKAERKRQRRELHAIDAFIRYCTNGAGPALFEKMCKAAGC